MNNDVDVVAKATSATLQTISWIVLVVGLVAAGVAVYLGFTANEPWALASRAVTEGWQSAGLGILVGALILSAALTAWGLLQAHRFHVLYGDHYHGRGPLGDGRIIS
jgi:di/tricarboxylate transporter